MRYEVRSVRYVDSGRTSPRRIRVVHLEATVDKVMDAARIAAEYTDNVRPDEGDEAWVVEVMPSESKAEP